MPWKVPAQARASDHGPGLVAEHLARDAFDSARHLGGGAAREGEQQDAAGIDAVDDEVGDAMRHGVCLARPGAGDDEQRTTCMTDAMFDRPALGGVEPVEVGVIWIGPNRRLLHQ